VEGGESAVKLSWQNENASAVLAVDLEKPSCRILASGEDGKRIEYTP